VIVTMTLNASLRVQYEAQRVDWGAQNRVTRVRYRAGGRGLAVARVLRTLGQDVVAAGLAGGATGALIATDLARSGVTTGFTEISGESRRILEVADAERGHTTILNEPPPYITTEELGRFAADYRRLMTEAAAVVLSGSLPVGLPPEIYGSLATYAAEARVPTIIDAGGEALRYGAARRPAVVVTRLPSPAGAADSAGAADPADVVSRADAAGRAGVAGPAGVAGQANAVGLAGATGLAGNRGVDAAALVAGGVGAVVMVSDHDVRVVTARQEWRGRLDGHPSLPGSRDALVAGLIPVLLEGWSWPDTLRHAIALGAAADSAGEVDLDAYDMLLSEVVVDQARRPRVFHDHEGFRSNNAPNPS
jgi:tagatose 6-phosphate kinase